jgi:hypothetical protein
MANPFDQFDAADDVTMSPEGRPRITIRGSGGASNDGLSPRDRELIVRTVLGEAAGEPDDGMAAVAAVIRNRLQSGQFGRSIPEVVLKPKQFEPWNTQDGRSRMMSYAADSEPYSRAAQAVDAVFGGAADPTNGATHFYSPTAQAALGREPPRWAQGEPQNIGRHAFYAPGGRAPAAAGAGAGAANPFDQFDAAAASPDREGPDARPTPAGGIPPNTSASPAGPIIAGGGFGAPGPATFNQRATLEGTPLERLIDPTMTARPQNAAQLAPALQRHADQRIASDDPGGEARAAIEAFANTAMLNVPRNIDAWSKSRESGRPFSEEYERLKAIEDAGARLNPKSAIGGTVGGVVAGAVALPGIGGGATMTARAGRAAATGAGYGFISEMLDSKDPVQASVAAALAGAIGFVAAPVAERIVHFVTQRMRAGRGADVFLRPDGTLTPEAQAAAREAGINPDDLGEVLSRAMAGEFAERGATPGAARGAAADEFNIRLSPGQATNDFPTHQYEQAAAHGAMGPMAARHARRFNEAQAGDIDTARAGFGERFAGGGPQAHSVDEAATTVREGLQSRAREARADFKGKYDQAFSYDGEFNDIAFRSVGERIGRRLTDGPEPVIIDDVTTPIAMRALADLDRISNLRVQNAADPRGAPDPSQVVGINLKGVDQARKRLVAYYSAAKGRARASGDEADARATQRILGAFDDEVEAAYTTGLFNGSDDALKSLREARASYSEYRKTYKGGPGDPIGRAMNHMIERDANAGEVANYLYGRAAIGEKGVSTALARRLKSVFGEGSEEWAAVKQGLWLRLTSKPEGVDDFGPQAISQRIAKFVNGDGADTARAVFSREELAQMGRFAVAVRNVVPPKGAVNHSGSAYTWAALQSSGLSGGAWFMGADPQTAASLAGLRLGGKLATDLARGRAARKHFAAGAPTPAAPPSPGASGSGVAGGLASGSLFQALTGQP